MSDLGFPARCTICQIFSEGHFVLFYFSLYFFYSSVTGFMLSTYAMFKNELNIQLLSRGKVKQVYSCAIDMRFDFWQSKQSIAFSGLNFSCLYFSSQLCWKLHFNNFDFGSLDWSFSGSASSCSVDISAVSSLCCCPKNAESIICFDINLHSRTSRERPSST